MRATEHTTTVDHVPVFYRTAEAGNGSAQAGGQSAQAGSESAQAETGSAQAAPVLYLHDAITSSEDLLPFLERTGGLAPDLIGFGRSGKGGHLDYTPSAYVDFVIEFLRTLGVRSVRLVGHGWGGAIGVLLALRAPELVERLVLIDAVPLLEGFTWHRAARLWRRALLGELVMGFTSRWMLSRELQKGTTRPNAWSRPRLTRVWDEFDQGTQRALLRLHRAADEAQLAALGTDLGSIACPTLIVWGDADPWFAPEFADAYAAQLGDAAVAHIPEAGHWPWLDQTRVVELVAEFLSRT